MVLVAIVVGVGGVFALFWAMDRVVNWLPDGFREGVRPYVYVGPAVVILAIFLVYPVFEHAADRASRTATGRTGWGSTTTGSCSPTRACLRSIRNTAGWVISSRWSP